MLLSRQSLLSLIALCSSVIADVEFITPAPGSAYVGGGTLGVSWKDSGIAPALSDLTNYVINLCAGGNDAGSFECSYGVIEAGGAFSSGNAASGVIVAASAEDATDAYFLQIVSTSTTGGQVINYSPRFSLSSMTGTLPATVIAAINALPVGTTTGPATSGSGLDPATPADGTSNIAYSNSYVVPYTMQTGPIRYAPMQPQPGTQITAQSASMAYPTSSVSLATTYLPPATQWQTTMTQSQTFSVASIENTGAPVPGPSPSDPMKRWLDRWKDEE